LHCIHAWSFQSKDLFRATQNRGKPASAGTKLHAVKSTKGPWNLDGFEPEKRRRLLPRAAHHYLNAAGIFRRGRAHGHAKEADI
jgi:hypothetical protein